MRRRAAVRLWLANIALATLVGANWLAHVPDVEGVRVWLFAVPALVSTAVLLTLVPGLVFVLAASLVPRTRTLAAVQGVFWTVFHVLLFADTRIYNAFRYHFNGQVWNLVVVRGSEDAIHLGWQVWVAIACGLALGGALQAWLWRRALVAAQRDELDTTRTRWRWILRPSFVWCAVLLPAIFLEKSIYAQADLARDKQVTAVAHLFPLYTRVPAEDWASKLLGIGPGKPPLVEVTDFELDYPRATPTLPADGARPSFLIVVVDCLRRDMLTDDVAPNLAAFAADARRFEDHASGGNSTRFGIFSMMYGLHGSYWFPVLREQRAPVLLETLEDAGYEIGVFSSATMSYPELRETAWSGIGERVHDDHPGATPWERDVQAGEAAIEWLEQRADDDAPFFAFVLLDAPHQTYSHPPDATPFQPSAPEMDYLAVTQNDGPPPEMLAELYNRYRNAVHHSDDVAGDILDALEASGLADDTIVIATGDHGEEFLECGFFGHTSAFTREQIAVPFVVRGPGIEPGVETRPTTHLDFAPTVLELLGADPAMRGDWCLGANFLDPPDERRRVISGWYELGVWTPEGILRVPLTVLEFDLEVYDYGWNLVLDDRAALSAEADTLERLGAECVRFLR